MSERTRVAVAMSGGVDSSVAAALMVKEGYDVTGLMLRLWSEPGKECENRCCTPDAIMEAQRVAAKLDIPFYVLDAREEFRGEIVQSFLEGYGKGVTPNPCYLCNRRIRWGYLLRNAQSMGMEKVATGHYARLRIANEETQLLRALDDNKDQSYILSGLSQEQLPYSIFPLGDYSKVEVREMARKFGLSTAERPDSQDLCFLGDMDIRDFLQEHLGEKIQPGNIVSLEGKSLGTHEGLPFYTIGQRKGIKIPASEAYYVLGKDIENNNLIVGTRDQLGKSELIISEMNWISGKEPALPLNVQVKIRYKAPLTSAILTKQRDSYLHIEFAQPLRDITPGQVAGIYQEEVCLGGGIIK
jgi:tRNA-specific 2-thiouridylase